MDKKLRLNDVIAAHWRSLEGRNGSKRSYYAQALVPAAVGILVVAPSLLALVPDPWTPVAWFVAHGAPQWSDYSGLLAFTAILFGFFFAMAVFVFQLRAEPGHLDPKHDVQTDVRTKPLVDELFANCTYAVVTTGTASALALLLTLYPGLGGYGGNGFLAALLTHIAMLSMMCVRRLASAYRKIVELRSFDNWKPTQRRTQNK